MLWQSVIQPVHDFLATFDSHVDFLNVDVESYVKSISRSPFRVQKTRRKSAKDNEDEDDEGQVEEFNLNTFKTTVEKHRMEAERVKESIPNGQVRIGIFSVAVGQIRKMLVDKHLSIVSSLLKDVAAKVIREAGRNFKAIL